MKYCFFDLETTGLNKDLDNILSFSAIMTDEKLKEIKSLDLYINNNVSIPEFITNLTGITEKLIREKGINPDTAAKAIYDFMSEADIICGYNIINFDNPWITKFLADHGFDFSIIDCLDVFLIAKEEVPESMIKMTKINRYGKEYKSYCLAAVADAFGISETFHNSLSDVKATIAVYEAIKNLERPISCTAWGRRLG